MAEATFNKNMFWTFGLSSCIVVQFIVWRVDKVEWGFVLEHI